MDSQGGGTAGAEEGSQFFPTGPTDFSQDLLSMPSFSNLLPGGPVVIEKGEDHKSQQEIKEDKDKDEEEVVVVGEEEEEVVVGREKEEVGGRRRSTRLKSASETKVKEKEKEEKED